VLFIDKNEGNYTIYWGEQYDQKGRLWRANGQGAIADEFHKGSSGYRNLYLWMYMNNLTQHYTVIDGIPRFICHKPKEVFTIQGLLRKTH